MKGSPLWQSALVVVGFLLLGIPVLRLTSGKPPPPSVVASQTSTQPPRPALLLVESLPPAHVTLSSAGAILAVSPEGEGAFEKQVPLSAEGADLVIAASIPEGRLAVRVEVRRDGELLAVQTFWGEASVRGVLTIPAAATDGEGAP